MGGLSKQVPLHNCLNIRYAFETYSHLYFTLCSNFYVLQIKVEKGFSLNHLMFCFYGTQSLAACQLTLAPARLTPNVS